MKTQGALPRRFGMPALAIVAGLAMAGSFATAAGERCRLPSHQVGLTLPVERVEPAWACRLEPIVSNYTTANKIGPVRIALPPSLYFYLLDRPPLAAALINRLDLGLYQAEPKGPHRYWGQDGAGTWGTVELVYRDQTSRIYYLDGQHESRLLPHVTGKAVLFMSMQPVKDQTGAKSTDTTLVAYTRLDSRVLSGLLSLLRPLVGGTVTSKLHKGVETVNRLGSVMRHQPQQVLFEASDSPPFADEDIAFLKQALAELGGPAHRVPRSPKS